MAQPPRREITRLLLAWNRGDDAALEELTPLVYQELRQLAQSYMRREAPGHALQPTALVHETYMRLVDVGQIQWQDRAHFFGMAARLMRRILVDIARAQGRAKRGGKAEHLVIDEQILADDPKDLDLLDLNEALDGLAALDQRKSQVVELRFFGGLTVEETAEALGVSRDTVLRDWRVARLWLLRELSADEEP